ncbi:hypothetical protein EVAR_38659_1 [Eumeta japonica]|uniref:Uncharacterized protein n=1 Tax=Eumeta variegata TaxID=151549 RepID=A0A4C1Y0U9_EUMVA|nr:hypothetical protein EVAR_38659_1 [Eumeta japonica]
MPEDACRWRNERAESPAPRVRVWAPKHDTLFRSINRYKDFSPPVQVKCRRRPAAVAVDVGSGRVPSRDVRRPGAGARRRRGRRTRTHRAFLTKHLNEVLTAPLLEPTGKYEIFMDHYGPLPRAAGEVATNYGAANFHSDCKITRPETWPRENRIVIFGIEVGVKPWGRTQRDVGDDGGQCLRRAELWGSRSEPSVWNEKSENACLNAPAVTAPIDVLARGRGRVPVRVVSADLTRARSPRDTAHSKRPVLSKFARGRIANLGTSGSNASNLSDITGHLHDVCMVKGAPLNSELPGLILIMGELTDEFLAQGSLLNHSLRPEDRVKLSVPNVVTVSARTSRVKALRERGGLKV